MSKKLIQISSSIASGIGVLLSIILTTFSIRHGYDVAREAGLNEYIVKLLGMPIFEIVKENDKFVGKGNYFLIILSGIIFALILTGVTLLIELLIFKTKKKKQDNIAN